MCSIVWQAKQKTMNWLLTSQSIRMLIWLHWSKNVNWRLIFSHVAFVCVDETFFWNWMSVCNVDTLLISSSNLISFSVQIARNSSVLMTWLMMLLSTRISILKVSQTKQKTFAKRMTFFRVCVLNWLYWSKNENSWRASKFRDCEYVDIISRWNWNFVCKVCKLFERLWFQNLMMFRSILI